jgi:hypothetical protein
LSLTSTNSTPPNLLEDAVRGDGAFNIFVGRDSRFSLDYANLQDAIIVDVNAAGTVMTLQIPGTGFPLNFVGTDRNNPEDELEDFLLEDAQKAYADFLKLVREQTFIDALDGNPSSVTAQLSIDVLCYTIEDTETG